MLIDTNVLLRMLVDDSPEQAERARRFLDSTGKLVLPDLIFAECVFVLESFYGYSRDHVAGLLERLLGARQIQVGSVDLLKRALGVYADGLDFPDAYLVAVSEASGAGPIVSFDRDFDRVAGVERIEP